MSDLNHYIIFRRTDGHCATWLVRAASLREAMLQYTLDWCAGSEALLDDRRLAVDDGDGGQVIYEHPLACIEAREKTHWSGWDWNGWEIKQLQPQHWEAAFAEVFCSENPNDVKEYIECCRPLLRQKYPRSRARAFIWYLKEGPLVTFYRPARRGRRWPVKILGRYLLPWKEWPQAQEWTGTYDDILEQMATEYPLP
jgi:hypothetical protein